MQKGIEINGSIFANEGDIDHDEFLTEFIKFIESKEWHYGGGTKLVDDKGNILE